MPGKLESKTAVVTGGGSGIGRAIAERFAAEGVRVNAIAPGPIRTEIWDVTGLSDEEAAEHEKRVTGANPMQRFGTPSEVADLALFLASDDASYITGAVMAIDGGDGAY